MTQAQAAFMAACVFCGRIRDRKFEETSTSSVVRFAPLDPVTAGHMLFVPVVHVVDAAAYPHVTGLAFQEAARWGKYNSNHFNLITSAGPHATQTVFHLHVHYVPRSMDDGLHLPWTGQQK